jgi:predicted RNA-binding protein Jag
VEARSLAEKSARLGRFYALMPMAAEDRARVLKAAAGVAGVRVHTEGEGRHRRVVFSPEKPAPLPRRSALPDWDEEEDAEA